MFCPKCDVTMDLHNDEDSCEDAMNQADAIQRVERLFWSIGSK